MAVNAHRNTCAHRGRVAVVDEPPGDRSWRPGVGWTATKTTKNTAADTT